MCSWCWLVLPLQGILGNIQDVELQNQDMIGSVDKAKIKMVLPVGLTLKLHFVIYLLMLKNWDMLSAEHPVSVCLMYIQQRF